MWILNNEDYREYQAYKATGMTPNEVFALRQGVYPDDEGRAPHPDLDPAEERRSFERDRRYELAEDFRELYQEIYGRGSAGLMEDEL